MVFAALVFTSIIAGLLCLLCYALRKCKMHYVSFSSGSNNNSVCVLGNKLYVDGVVRATIDPDDNLSVAVHDDYVVVNGQTFTF